MESLKLTNLRDIEMRNGDIQLIDGKDEIIQTFSTLFKTAKNEWFLNTDLGFDYSLILGVKWIDEEELIEGINDVINQMEEIDEIISINIDHDRENRRAYVTIDLSTIDGIPIKIEGVELNA